MKDDKAVEAVNMLISNADKTSLCDISKQLLLILTTEEARFESVNLSAISRLVVFVLHN